MYTRFRRIFIGLTILSLLNPLPSFGRPAWGRSSGESEGESRIDRSRPLLTIHVFGAVNDPGTYLVPASERLLAAIKVAKGLKSIGTERRIELRRYGKLKLRIDLLKLRRTGDLSLNPFLQNNDLIFVPFQTRAVAIHGPVREPGVYELLPNENLKDLVQDLGLGFTPGADRSAPLKIIRYQDGNEKEVIAIANKENAMAEFVPESGDVVQVPHKFLSDKTFDNSVAKLPLDNIAFPSFTSRVFVIGGVRVPQSIEYDPRFRVSDYVAMAGGLTRLGRPEGRIRKFDGSESHFNLESHVGISPGDTLVIDEDRLGPEFWITFMTTLTGIALNAVSVYALLKRN